MTRTHDQPALQGRAPAGHLTLDASGVIEELDLSCAALLGQERCSLQGKRLGAFVAPEDGRRLEAHVRACFDGSSPLILELSIPLPGSNFRPVELVSVPSVHTAGERSRTFHSVMADISARKREADDRERLLHRERQARLLAERLNVAQEDFLAVVSHELRAPLAPMTMWTKALRAQGLDEAVQLRAVDAIDACVQFQLAMIDDLVDVARGRHGKLRIQRQAVDLQPILAAALEASAPSIAAKQLALAVQVDVAPAWVTGDAVRLRQVVGNLLSNAVKFTREAGHIGVELRPRGDDVVLTVRDDGEGIDGALLPEIFEPFRQHAGGTERHHGGLGLGLTIVRQLVEQHGGTVTAASPGLDRGSRFTVTLPRREETPATEKPASLRRGAVGASPQRERCKTATWP